MNVFSMRGNKLYRPIALLLFITFYFVTGSYAQLVVTTAQPASVLASTLVGPGITILNPTLTCPGVANGTFTATGTLLSMANGVVLTNGHASACAGPEGTLVSSNNGTAGDAAMTALLPAGSSTYDACTLEFDMVAAGDSVGFNYQFGSEEYRSAVCTQYTDIFAFFISGPGITGAQNCALVPGTTIPVEVNSVNNGVPGSSGGVLSNCTSIGAGSPFTAYYLDNTGGTSLSYRGFTTKFRAVHSVTPCDTYHLKLCIVDGGNATYDSGVFLEGNSLTTNTYTFDHAAAIGGTVNGVPDAIVKTCAPTTVSVIADHPNTSPVVLNLSFGGTAVNGVDIATIPSTLTFPASSTSVGINVQALATPVSGTKTLIIYLNGSCGILDSIAVNILDSPSAILLTPDTTVCLGQPFQLQVIGSTGMVYSWSPSAGLSATSDMEPICTPLASTTYFMDASLPGSGCADIVASVAIDVETAALSYISNDTTICYGASAGLTASSGGPLSVFTWSPSAGLSNPGIQSPIAMPLVTTTYTVSSTVPGVGCAATGTVTVTVANPNIILQTTDTTICKGASLLINVSGNPLLNFSWGPAIGLDNPNSMSPVATPSVNTTYTVTTTTPGEPCMATAQISISLTSLTVSAASQVIGCNSGVNFTSQPDGANFSFLWSGPDSFMNTAENPQISHADSSASGVYSVTVIDGSNGCSGMATTTVVVLPPSALALTDITPGQTIAYGGTVQLQANNALYYHWLPNDGSLNNPNVNNPVATPTQSTIYTVYGMDTAGCMDSASIAINVTFDSISIPTAFTPNNDGLNDIFRPVNMKYQNLIQFSVYNRWGQQIFNTANKEVGWDGTFNGVAQDIGTYNYVLIVSQDNGETKLYKGDVTLIK